LTSVVSILEQTSGRLQGKAVLGPKPLLCVMMVVMMVMVVMTGSGESGAGKHNHQKGCGYELLHGQNLTLQRRWSLWK